YAGLGRALPGARHTVCARTQSPTLRRQISRARARGGSHGCADSLMRCPPPLHLCERALLTGENVILTSVAPAEAALRSYARMARRFLSGSRPAPGRQGT